MKRENFLFFHTVFFEREARVVVKRNTKVLSLILLDRSHLHKKLLVSFSLLLLLRFQSYCTLLPCTCCKLADSMNMASEYQVDDVLLSNNIGGRAYVFYLCMSKRGLNCCCGKIFRWNLYKNSLQRSCTLFFMHKEGEKRRKLKSKASVFPKGSMY